MYRWHNVALIAVALAIQSSTVKAESCHETEQQDLLCFSPSHKVVSRTREAPAASFWGGVPQPRSGDVPVPVLPENAGLSARTDSLGKTTYYDRHGQSIGTSTVDITGNVHYRDRNGGEVERLW